MIKLSLRREKRHLELLKLYGGSDYAELYRYEQLLKGEIRTLVLEMARQTARAADQMLRLNFRVRLSQARRPPQNDRGMRIRAWTRAWTRAWCSRCSRCSR